MYNALNHKIRDLLLSYDLSKSADPLQAWTTHITSLLTRDSPKTSDIELLAPSESFHLHKFILSARSPYFRKKFAEGPGTPTWKLAHAIPVEAFRLVLRYMYLGDLPRDLVGPRSTVSEEEVARGIDKLCKQLEMEKLWETVLCIGDRRLARQRHQDEVHRAQQQVEAFFRDTVIKHKIVANAAQVDDIKWPHDNAIFANCLLRADVEQDVVEGGEEAETATEQQNSIPVGPGTNAAAHGSANSTKPQRKSVLYPVHKAFLIRSPYFETMFSSRFLEAQESECLHIIHMDCSPEILEIVLAFLYTERMECTLELALDLLYTADMLLLDKLKTKAAVAISTLGSGNSSTLVDRTHREGHKDDEEEPIDIYDVIHAAWDLRVQRLEEFAARYLASRLEDYIDREDFAHLIRESAARLKARQETDTIELLDDIRYYLDDRFRLRFDGDGMEKMLDENDVLDAANGRGEDADAVAPVAGVRTLEGQLVEDEFTSDAHNYQILLRKIDDMLARLKLDA